MYRTPVRRIFGDRIEWGGDQFHLQEVVPGGVRRLLCTHFRVLIYRAAPFRTFPLRAYGKCATL